MISLNGQDSQLLPGETLTVVLRRHGVAADARGVAVAVDGQVVPQVEWESFVVAVGARVEVLTAMQGG